MGRIKKKGTSGATNNYLTRSQAVRKLQLPLGDFRRLCIFKGVYPRDPSSRSKKRISKSATPSTTFYYAKDIQYLLHEPLLAQLREKKALEKKIAKALGRGDLTDASRWEREHMPRMRLDHIVKERYPTFVDALRDLDDALSMLYLFASIPSTPDVPPSLIARCHRLTLEWEHYLIRSNTLRKSFLSIKGIYYQATIQGQDILWLVPYKFVMGAGRTGDAGGDLVDWRIMRTFVEFYTTLLGFVNFRLFTAAGVVYPPKFDVEAGEKGAELGAVKLEGRDASEQERIESREDVEGNERAQAEADRLLSLPADEPSDEQSDAPNGDLTTTEDAPTQTLDEFQSVDPQADTLLQPSPTADASVASHLFEPFTFFLSRETPRHPIEFLLKAFGCKRVGWDTTLGSDPGSYCSEDDARITHQIVDRPDLPLPSPPATDDDEEAGAWEARKKLLERVPGRIYVQPQWVWDCVNAGVLQRPDLYAPGATLPPHLSPWVKVKRGEYDPTVPLAEQNGAEVIEDDDEEIEEGSEGEEVDGVRGDEEARELEEELVDDEEEEADDGGMDIELAGSDDDEENEAPTKQAPDDWAGFSGDEEDADVDDSARQTQLELEAEALGRNADEIAAASKSSTSTEAKRAARSRAEREKQEEVERRKGMMSRKKRKIFEKMEFSNARRDEKAEGLRAKKRRIEKAASSGAK
ncbi:Pescadillo N-terminus-domain-containing protein [Neohortaea acidophila]|uniref:Pescadillo homolog n=1 Tax=Neohortaea acidophila TaxID=245834 RepID=A0A6A6PV79_9PEZI|nr:Pescadillo N-terminus-domain-containing protein [Neohortaea acidophila]KAF2483892.1 Pescadillo N-terminus-domain-containing protein [Neohortaea acidophila]